METNNTNNTKPPKNRLPFFVDYTEDDIVERKLFYEGGSSLDDTTISRLTRTISKFCCEPDKLRLDVRKDGTPPIIPTVEEQFEDLTKIIEACRAVAIKSSKVISVCERELDYFMEAIIEEEDAVRTSQKEVSKAALDLEYQKKLLSIQTLPATSETEAKLAEVARWGHECENKINRRKKQFEMLADVTKRLDLLLQDDSQLLLSEDKSLITTKDETQ